MSDLILLHSMIKKYFKDYDILLELDKLSMIHSVDNNTKGLAVNQILTGFNVPFRAIGSGTNRYAVLIEDYIFKIALDEDGKTDNKREFIYTKAGQPYVIRVYECMANGLIAVCEYYEVFSENDFYSTKNQAKMRKILKELSKIFLIGDIGINKKNYTNWGYSQLTGEIGILDFAYIYNLSYRAFQCTCPDHGLLYYDNDYNQLICPICAKKHTFWEVRKRIPRKQEEEEIGDIRTKGYVVSKEWSKEELNPDFTDVPKENKVKKKKRKKEIDYSDSRNIIESNSEQQSPYEVLIELINKVNKNKKGNEDNE